MRSMIAAMASAPTPADWTGHSDYMAAVFGPSGDCVDNSSWEGPEAESPDWHAMVGRNEGVAGL